jgi:thioredoxin reductase
MYELIIVGGGPAGLSAAIYALGKQRNFLLIYEHLGGKADKRQHLAGQVATENLAGEDAVRQFGRTLSAQTDRTLNDRVTSVDHQDGGFLITTEHHGVYESVTVIVATGASSRQLLVPGATSLLGQGLGYSVTTHAPLLAGKTAAVIGGSSRVLRGVVELAHTAAQVYLIIPDWNTMGAPMVQAVQHLPNIEVLPGYQVREVVGPAQVTEVVVAYEGQERRLRVDAAFVDLGLIPNSAIVQPIAQTDQDGFIVVDQRNATSVPGLFAAGDVTTALAEQVLIAIGEGARAAVSAYDYYLLRSPAQRSR